MAAETALNRQPAYLISERVAVIPNCIKPIKVYSQNDSVQARREGKNNIALWKKSER